MQSGSGRHKQMKRSFNFLMVLLLPLFTSCSVVNAVRHKVAPPPAVTASPEPKKSTPLDPANTEALKVLAKNIAMTDIPLKLDPKASIRGKVLLIDKYKYSVVIEGFTYAGDDYLFVPGTYRLTQEDLAIKPDEVVTAILKTCEKGKTIGEYELAPGKFIPAYTTDCKVSIIDYPNAKVIAEKKFPGKGMDDYVVTSNTATEWTAPEPSEAIKEYISKFPRK
jgi:hypothetical protein